MLGTEETASFPDDDGAVEGLGGMVLERVSSMLLLRLLPVPGVLCLADDVRGGGVGGGLFIIDFLRTGRPCASPDCVIVP
jgi:hypothetical protein